MEKTVIKFGDTEIEKQKFHQYKQYKISPVSIKDIDINKIDLCAYFFQKCVHVEKTLIKLNKCRF